MSFIEDFSSWERKVTVDINFVAEYLAQRLSDEPEALIQDLEAIEAWNGRVGFLLAEANSWLDQAAHVYRPEKDGSTAFDRQIDLDTRLAGFRSTRDKIEALASAIKQRLILGESILGYYKQFADRKGVETKDFRKILGGERAGD